jgi:acyl transferase domain-containing protein
MIDMADPDRMVAIVGMALTVPGAKSVEQYWRNLVDGVDAITDVPPDRWDEEFYDPSAPPDQPDRVYCKRGGFIDTVEFEPLKFGIMPKSVTSIEPDQLIALQVASSAIEDAGGHDKLPGPDRIGIILGRGGVLSPAQARYAQRIRIAGQVLGVLRDLFPDIREDQLEMVRQRLDEKQGPHQPEGTIGLVPNLTASRVANRLNLRGPAYTLDAACASSLIALDQGVTELLNGRLDAVLCGGVHHSHDITYWSVFSQLGAMSRRGQIRPFDKDADGMLLGEGTGMVLIKRLPDALRDGDRIHAVVRGVGVSSDGKSASLFNPERSGQVLAIRRAWQMAGLDPTAPDALGLLEAHATGTPTGDGVELTSIAEVFGPANGAERLPIGSVKSMIGHSTPAAGVAGLIKATLAVSRGVLLPTLHCDNPRAEMERTRFAPIATARPWESDGPRRAAVNAFGFGGANAHVIVEQAPERPVKRSGTAGPVKLSMAQVDEPDQVLLLAAPTPHALATLLEQDDTALRAAGTEWVTGDRPISEYERCRLGIADPTDKRLTTARRVVARGTAWRGGRDVWYSPEPLVTGGSRIGFVFPGLEGNFEPRVDDLAARFGLPNREWGSADLGQLGGGVLELGAMLDTALRRIGVVPDAVAGYSLGEWAATSTAGLLRASTVDEFLEIFDPNSIEIPGLALAAVGASAQRVTELLAGHPDLVLSHDNGPAQCIVCGPEAPLQAFVEDLRGRNILCQVLPFRSAFHTPMFAPCLEPLAAATRRWEVGTPSAQIWSATLAAPFPSDAAEVLELFGRHLIEPVRFREEVAAMYADGVRVFLSVGTGQLASVISDNLRDQDHLAMQVNVPHRSGLNQLRRVATALWVEGAAPDLRALTDRPAPAKAEPARKGPAVKLDMGSTLVRLGDDADRLLGAGAPAVAGTGGESAELAALRRLSGRSSAAAELDALLRDTARTAAAVLAAAPVTTPPRPPAAAAPPVAPPAPAAPRPPATPPPAPPEQPAGGEVRSTLTVSLETMPYLLDHCFFRQPEDWGIHQDRWPVVPATTVATHMMEAAEKAVPGSHAVRIRNAEFNKWVLAEPAQDIQITVKPLGGNDYAVSFGRSAKSIVTLAPEYSTEGRPAVWWEDPATEEPARISPEEMYGERLMFHGPLFHGVTEVHALGEMHVRGVLTNPTPPGALLDNALQMLGNWLVTTQPSRVVALPVKLTDIRFFGPPPAVGARVGCNVRVRHIDRGTLIADIQLLDANGDVWAVMDGCTDRRFDSHPQARAAERFPERHAISYRKPGDWTLVFDHWTDVVTRTMVANLILGGAGYAEYDKVPLAFRKQWMLGRIAAKDASRYLMWDGGAQDIFPIELPVTDGPDGRPQVHPRDGRGLPDCDVALASCAEAGVAIARVRRPGQPQWRLGIDIVEITDAPPEVPAAELALLPPGTEGAAQAVRAARQAVVAASGADPARIAVTAATGDTLTVTADAQPYQVGYQVVGNPDDLPARRYAVAWTDGPATPDRESPEEARMQEETA